MNFSDKINKLRNKAQETQAANKIIDMLKQIELKNDTNTSYRWIWELIQNAKDVANSSGFVDISIVFNTITKTIQFKHNGRLFTTKNLVFLIEQVSTKDRDSIELTAKKTIGKFGTGFLTTHLLSKKVTVSGFLQDEEDSPYSFSLDLDRTSDKQYEIIKSIENSCMQLENSSKKTDIPPPDNDYNTCFTYCLDNTGVKIAKNGIVNLIDTAPFVFAFVSEINSITIDVTTEEKTYKQIINRKKTIKSNLDNTEVVFVIVETQRKIKERCIFKYNDKKIGDLTIAIEVASDHNGKHIIQMSENLPKLFCDFPLLGTFDFPFPVVINCPSFNPTEPRDGVFLVEKDFDYEEPKDITENKQILLEAKEHYIELLNYFIKENYDGIYNITKIINTPTKEWLSEEWINKEIIEDIKNTIVNINLIENTEGQMCSIFDEWGDLNLSIPKHNDLTIRNKLWELLKDCKETNIPKFNDLTAWNLSLWEECGKFTVEDLATKIACHSNIEELQSILKIDVFQWLILFYEFLFSADANYAIQYLRKEKAVPNQNGEFKSLNELQYNDGVENEYINHALLLKSNIKSKLIHDQISAVLIKEYRTQKYKFENYVTDILNSLNFSQNQADFHKHILCMQNQKTDKQTRILSLLNSFYKDNNFIPKQVNNFSEILFEKAFDYWLNITCQTINDCSSIKSLIEVYKFSKTENVINWINDFKNFLIQYQKKHLFDEFALLPNQKNKLKKISELSLDNGDINDVLKDVCEISDFDIRDILLNVKISYSLPKQRIYSNENIAEKVTSYIKLRKNKLGNNADEKLTFQKLYIYLRELNDSGTLPPYFEELGSNLHWFYNEDDIANNMKRVEECNAILEKFGLSNLKDLESTLLNVKEQNKDTEKIEISKELLAEWGITSEEELKKALSNNIMGNDFIYEPKHNSTSFDYVKGVLERSKKNIFNHLKGLHEYDVTSAIPLSNTIFIVQKNGEEIYIIARPSDYGQVVIYYDTEIDVLDYEKDCELWVEEGKSTPQKITFGKILRLTKVNKIPLKEIYKL